MSVMTKQLELQPKFSQDPDHPEHNVLTFIDNSTIVSSVVPEFNIHPMLKVMVPKSTSVYVVYSDTFVPLSAVGNETLDTYKNFYFEVEHKLNCKLTIFAQHIDGTIVSSDLNISKLKMYFEDLT